MGLGCHIAPCLGVCSTQKCCSSVLHISPQAVRPKHLLKAQLITWISVIHTDRAKVSKVSLKKKKNTVESRLCRTHTYIQVCSKLVTGQQSLPSDEHLLHDSYHTPEFTHHVSPSILTETGVKDSICISLLKD